MAAGVWRIPCVSVDNQGESFFSHKQVNVGKPTSANAIGALSELSASGMIFRETPGEYDFDFHCAPQRQFIICLDAGVDIETSGGDRQIFPAGSMFFVEDTWGKGHRSRAVDGKTRRSVFITVPDDVFPPETNGS
jgi:hypothetical protein